MIAGMRGCILALTIIVIFGVVYTLAYPESEDWVGIPPGEDRSFSQKIFNRTYFSASVFTTIGMGHVSPKVLGARVLVFFQMVLLIMGVVRLFTASQGKDLG